MQRAEQRATAVSNNSIKALLNMRTISTTTLEQHCTEAGREQASKGCMDNLTDVLSPPVRKRAQRGNQLPEA